MRWFYVEGLARYWYEFETWFMLYVRVRDPAARKRIYKESNQQAIELLESALRRERWLAEYENRPERSLQEVTKELVASLKKKRLGP